ncbi:Helix-turn-helix domain (DUF4817) [Popillia japonica]|uniref:Helix-turn-helix domain (DUF4817) n=1 Tax=Popillia japonica TaxID=7064 RepID=A0AAW1KRZ5_POPJA
MPLTVQENIQILLWHAGNKSYQDAQNLFVAAFENRPPPSVPAIHKIVNKFRTDGCVHSRQCKRGRVVAEEQEEQEILKCASVEEYSSLSSRQIAAMLGISTEMVLKAFIELPANCRYVRH